MPASPDCWQAYGGSLRRHPRAQRLSTPRHLERVRLRGRDSNVVENNSDRRPHYQPGQLLSIQWNDDGIAGPHLDPGAGTEPAAAAGVNTAVSAHDINLATVSL